MPLRPVQKGGTVVQRLDRLERQYETLGRELDETRETLEDRIGAVERRANELHAEQQRALAERDQERRARLRTTVRLQGVGTLLITLGVVLTLGAALAC